MFLDVIRRRNPRLIEQAIALHQAGHIPANTYVIDLDAVEANARAIATEAKRLGLKVFAMTKQMGRNGDFCRAVVSGGIGTSTVSYKGETFYVCCSGCAEAFRENPEKYIAEFEAKKKK